MRGVMCWNKINRRESVIREKIVCWKTYWIGEDTVRKHNGERDRLVLDEMNINIL